MLKKLCAIALLSLLVGCQTGNTITIDRLPKWIDTGKTVGQLEVVSKTAIQYPNAVINIDAQTFTVLSYTWLEQYLDWTWKVAKIADIDYTPESFNCVDFSLMFSAFADLAASHAGIKAAPLIARVAAQTGVHERHELIGVATDKGLFIVEPQPEAGPFRITPIEKYTLPILSITFKDYNAP